MNFIVHIGTHKTGSSALQKFLYENRAALLKKGFLYPQKGIKGKAHHQLALAMRERNQIALKEILIGIKKEADFYGVNKIILSSEGFEYIENRDFFKTVFEKGLQIVLFIRRQDNYIESEYNQHVKMYGLRYTKDIYQFYFRYPFESRLNYKHVCNAWRAVLNGKCIHVINYDNSASKHSGIFEGFLSQIGIDWDDDFIIPDSVNSSIPALATLYLARINRLNLSPSLHRFATEIITKKFEALPKQQLFSYEDRLILWNKFRESNKFIVNSYGVAPFIKPSKDNNDSRLVVNFYNDFDVEIYNEIISSIESHGKSPIGLLRRIIKS